MNTLTLRDAPTAKLLPLTDLPLLLIEDPGHAWLRAPRRLLRAVGLSEADFSTCSYLGHRVAGESGDIFLEEDCDLPVFVRAANSAGFSVAYETIVSNRDSFVRSLPPNRFGK